MKRHLQETGIRKWFGDDLIELQSQPLKAIDEFFKPYASCVISGCEVSGSTINPGLVAFVWDSGGQRYAKVVPFAGASGVGIWPQYLYLEETAVTREYQSGGVKNIAIDSKAAMTSTIPAFPYVRILAGGPEKTFRDVIQTSSYRLVTDAQIANWNGKQDASTAWNKGNFNPDNYWLKTDNVTRATRLDPHGEPAHYSIQSDGCDKSMVYRHYSGHKFYSEINNIFKYNDYDIFHSGNLNRSDVDFIARNIVIADNESAWLQLGRYRTADLPNAYIGLIPGITDGGIVFQVQQNGSSKEALIIDKSGFVGIGTKTPEFALDVNGAIKSNATILSGSGFQNTAFVSNARNPIWSFGNAPTYGLSYYQTNDPNTERFGFHFGNYESPQFSMYQNGDFSVRGKIIATDPRGIVSTNLDLSSSPFTAGGITAVQDNDIFYPLLTCYSQLSSGYFNWPAFGFMRGTDGANGDVVISNRGDGLTTKYWKFKPDGNIDTPLGRVYNVGNLNRSDVDFTCKVLSNYGGSMNFYGYVGGYSEWVNRQTGTGIRFYTDNAIFAMQISPGGNVGIGTTAPNYKLDVNGSIVGTNIGSGSDRRWKKQIKPYAGVLDKLIQLQMVSFRWKDKNKDQRLNIGYISQEVEPLFPELVLKDAKGYMSLEYPKFGVLAIEGLKELRTDVYDELALLRKELAELRSLLNK